MYVAPRLAPQLLREQHFLQAVQEAGQPLRAAVRARGGERAHHTQLSGDLQQPPALLVGRRV